MVCIVSYDGENANHIKLINKPIVAILGTIAKNAVTIFGAPSYTSGAHIWKGAAANLNKIAIAINRTPILISNVEVISYQIKLYIPLKFVSPVKIYINVDPNNNKPELRLPRTKYFKPASVLYWLCLLIVANK